MKDKFLNGNRIPAVFMCIVFAAVLVVSGCMKNDQNVSSQPYNISGNANGMQVVPSDSATATGTITGTFDPTTSTLNFASTWTGLTGVPTSASFFAGAPGVAGTNVGETWALDSTMTTSGSFSGNIVLTSDQASQLLAGNMYYSFATVAYPVGEIRGQITATR